jgi:type IV pilus assembly protein PilO
MAENKKLLTYVGLGFILLLVIGGVYAYFGLLSPLHHRIESVDMEMKQQEVLLKKANESVAVTTQTSENTFALQEEVPVKPLVDQLMLQFEKAEVLSDSLILTMDFSDGEASEEEEVVAEEEASDSSTPEGPANEETTETENADESAENVTEEVEDEDANESNAVESTETPTPAVPEVLPQGVKKITAEMSVVSKNYEGIQKFIRTIEELKRVIVVEGITFTGMEELEIASADAVTDQLKYEITISAYYLPELTDYLKDLPKGEFPAPNGKDNPLINNDEE